MSSSNKTNRIGLNEWVGTDVPKMEDFNADNARLDKTLGNHLDDISIHVTSAQKDRWDNPYYIQSYSGNVASSRKIELKCSFAPAWGIIFPSTNLVGVTDFDNKAHYNYFGIFSEAGSTLGLTFAGGKSVTVTDSTQPISNYEFKNFNQLGTSYVIVMFR